MSHQAPGGNSECLPLDGWNSLPGIWIWALSTNPWISMDWWKSVCFGEYCGFLDGYCWWQANSTSDSHNIIIGRFSCDTPALRTTRLLLVENPALFERPRLTDLTLRTLVRLNPEFDMLRFMWFICDSDSHVIDIDELAMKLTILIYYKPL